MRTHTLTAALLAAIGLLTAGAVVYAAQAEELPKPPKVESPAGPPPLGPGHGPFALPPWLELTEEQQEKIADIREDTRKDVREKVRGILTDEQAAQLDAFAKWMQQRPDRPASGPGKPGGPNRGFRCPPCPMGAPRGRSGARCPMGGPRGRGRAPCPMGGPRARGAAMKRRPRHHRGGWGGRGAGPWWLAPPEEDEEDD